MAVVEGRFIRVRVALAVLLLLALSALILAPVIVVVLISVQKGNTVGANLWPDTFSLEHWQAILTGSGFFPVQRWLWNSTKIGVVTALIVTPLTALSAYALARLNFRGRRPLTEATFLLQGFPTLIFLFVFYILLARLSEYVPALGKNSHGGLILVYCSGILSGIWLLRGYFQTLDPALEEAALLDGASRFQIFRYVLLPLCLPMLGIQFILTIIGTFGDFMLPRALLDDDNLITVAVGISRFHYQKYQIIWGQFAVTAILAAMPIVVLFLLCQRALISGLSSGATKG